MSIPPAFLDELRARVDLPALLGGKVKLVRSGREWKGCCPFHQERTPSFYVYADHYHCFGCGAHGDGLSWLVEREGLPFLDAVAELAARAGMEVPRAGPAAQAKARAAAGLREVTEAAARWFSAQLWGAEGGGARAYLERRGVSGETARAFGLGFAPDARGRLRRALGEHGDERLLQAGLLVAPEGGGEPYDRFRGRLIFPIRDARGRCVGFGGRALGDAQPKYLNSPDTPLFDKGRLLYNLDRAAGPARVAGRLLVVEGYMDVIALAGAGIAEAVAPLGTAMTQAQMALAWRLVPEPVLCFDGDAAGRRAAVKAAVRALPGLEPGRSLHFMNLPEGRDPDDVVREGGAEAFEARVAGAVALADLLWRAELEAADLSTPERRAGLRARLRELVGQVSERTVRAAYAAEFRARLDALFGGQGRDGRREAVRRAPRLPAAPEPEAAAIIAGLLEHPRLADEHAEALADLPIRSTTLVRLRDAILDAAARESGLESAGLWHTLARQGLRESAEELRDRNQLRFSFTQARTSFDIASRDLACVIEALMAHRRLDDELESLRRRYNKLSEADLAEQQRLVRERREALESVLAAARALREAASEQASA